MANSSSSMARRAARKVEDKGLRREAQRRKQDPAGADRIPIVTLHGANVVSLGGTTSRRLRCPGKCSSPAAPSGSLPPASWRRDWVGESPGRSRRAIGGSAGEEMLGDPSSRATWSRRLYLKSAGRRPGNFCFQASIRPGIRPVRRRAMSPATNPCAIDTPGPMRCGHVQPMPLGRGLDADDDVADLLAGLDVPVGLDDLVQRVPSVDDRLELLRTRSVP